MRTQSYSVSSPNAMLLYDLQQQLAVTGTTYDDSVLCNVPDNVTDSQVQAVINTWSPSQTLPPGPQQQALAQIQQLASAAKDSWSNFTPDQKDQVLHALAEWVLNQQL